MIDYWLSKIGSMKSRSIITIILLLIGVKTFSQFEKLLFQVSYDYVLYPFFRYDYHDNNSSYRLGGTITYYVSNRISIASGIYYESKKYIVDYPPSNSLALKLTSEKFDFSYIGFPIIVELEVLSANSHLLSIQTGFELKSLRSKEIVLSYTDGSTRNGLDDYNVHDIIHSLSLGASYRYLFLDNFFIGACPKVRYNLTSHGITTGESTTLSFLFQLSFGYGFE